MNATEQVPRTRAVLVRYFAWGYLSRRELNDILRTMHTRSTQPQREMHSAA